MTDGKLVKVTLTGSPIGRTQRVRQVLRGLGLTRRGRTVVRKYDGPTAGMIRRVAHLVTVEDA